MVSLVQNVCHIEHLRREPRLLCVANQSLRLPKEVHQHLKLQLCCRELHDLCQYLLCWAQSAHKLVWLNHIGKLASTLLCQGCMCTPAHIYMLKLEKTAAVPSHCCMVAKAALRVCTDIHWNSSCISASPTDVIQACPTACCSRVTCYG